MPRAPKRKETSKKEDDFEIDESLKQENIKTFKQEEDKKLNAYGLKPTAEKKPFQWRLITARILPIFLFVLLAATISIAAVPSWRNAFNNFIAKFSPQASEKGWETGPVNEGEAERQKWLEWLNKNTSTTVVEDGQIKGEKRIDVKFRCENNSVKSYNGFDPDIIYENAMLSTEQPGYFLKQGEMNAFPTYKIHVGSGVKAVGIAIAGNPEQYEKKQIDINNPEGNLEAKRAFVNFNDSDASTVWGSQVCQWIEGNFAWEQSKEITVGDMYDLQTDIPEGSHIYCGYDREPNYTIWQAKDDGYLPAGDYTLYSSMDYRRDMSWRNDAGAIIKTDEGWKQSKYFYGIWREYDYNADGNGQMKMSLYGRQILSGKFVTQYYPALNKWIGRAGVGVGGDDNEHIIISGDGILREKIRDKDIETLASLPKEIPKLLNDPSIYFKEGDLFVETNEGRGAASVTAISREACNDGAVTQNIEFVKLVPKVTIDPYLQDEDGEPKVDDKGQPIKLDESNNYYQLQSGETIVKAEIELFVEGLNSKELLKNYKFGVYLPDLEKSSAYAAVKQNGAIQWYDKPNIGGGGVGYWNRGIDATKPIVKTDGEGKAVIYFKGDKDKLSSTDKLKSKIRVIADNYFDIPADSDKGVEFGGEKLPKAELNKEKSCFGKLDADTEKKTDEILSEPEEKPISIEDNNKNNILVGFNNLKNKILSLFNINQKVYSQGTSEECAACKCASINEYEKEVGDIKTQGIIGFKKENMQVAWTIKNTSSQDAENLDVYFKIPQFIEITNHEGLVAEGEFLKKHFDKISSDSEESIEFSFRIKDLDQYPENGIFKIETQTKKNDVVVDGDPLIIYIPSGDDPTTKIYRIERSINGNIQEVYPLDEGQTPTEKQKTLMYQDESGNWQLKVYPGDVIFYNIKYIRQNQVPVDLIVRYPDSAVDYGEVTNDKLVSYKNQDVDYPEKKLIYKRYKLITFDSEKSILFNYWIKVGDDVDLKYHQIGTWVKTGQVKFKWLLWGKASGVEFNNNLSVNWQRNDLFGYVKGKISVPSLKDTRYLANGYVELLSKQLPDSEYKQTDITKEEIDSIKATGDSDLVKKFVANHYTSYNFADDNDPKNGSFELEYNRRKDLSFNNQLKFKVQYKDYQDRHEPDGNIIPNITDSDISLYRDPKTPNWSLLSDQLDNDLVSGFTTKVFNISSQRVTNQDITISSFGAGPEIEYPDRAKNEDLFYQAVNGALIFNNAKKTKYYLASNVNQFKTNDFPKARIVTDSLMDYGFYNWDTKIIHIGKKVWQPSTMVPISPQVELHELGHLIENEISSSAFYPVGFTATSFPDDKIPYKYIYKNHNGIINDFADDSMIEGFARFMQVWLNRKIDNKFNSWIGTIPSGEEMYNLDLLYPPAYTTSKNFLENNLTFKNTDTLQLEEVSIAGVFRDFITGTPDSQLDQTYPWHSYNSNDLAYIQTKTEDEAFQELIDTIDDSSPRDFGELYDALIIKYNKDDLEKLFINHGMFHDMNCDWTYQSDEIPGYIAQDQGFGYDIVNIKYDGSKEILKGTIGPRYWRKFPPLLPGAYIKIDFRDQSGNKVDNANIKVKIEFKEPYQNFNYDNTFLAKNGELAYIALPYSLYETKAIITAEGSEDKIELDSSKYWEAINSGLYDYFAQKTFTIGGKTAETPADTPIVIIPTNEDNKQISSTGGGETINIDLSGFNNSSKIDIYAGKQKIGSTPVLSENFGLKIQVPENIPLGKNNIKIIGENGEEANTNLWITHNNWFNKYTAFLAGLFILIILLVIWIYRIVSRYIKEKTNLARPIGNVMVIVFALSLGLLVFSGIKVFASLTSVETQSLDKTTMENINGYIRLPYSPIASDLVTVIADKDGLIRNYGAKEPSSKQWGMPKTICFIERLAKEWQENVFDYYVNVKKVDNTIALKRASEEKIIINDISAADNSNIGHLGHTNGLDIDLWGKSITPFIGTETDYSSNPEWEQDGKELAQRFADLLNSHKNDFGVETIYLTQPNINGITNIDGHRVHWHVGLKK